MPLLLYNLPWYKSFTSIIVHSAVEWLAEPGQMECWDIRHHMTITTPPHHSGGGLPLIGNNTKLSKIYIVSLVSQWGGTTPGTRLRLERMINVVQQCSGRTEIELHFWRYRSDSRHYKHSLSSTYKWEYILVCTQGKERDLVLYFRKLKHILDFFLNIKIFQHLNLTQ